MTATITIKTDAAIKEKAQKLAKSRGVSLTMLINRYLERFIKTKTAMVQKTYEEDPNAYLQNLMKQADEDYKKGNTSPRFTNAEDFIEYLHKQSS